MKNKLLSLSIILVLLFLTACESNDVKASNFLFKGESNSWSAELRVNSTMTSIKKDNRPSYKTHEELDLSIIYKGKKETLASAKQLSYECEYNAGSLSGTVPKPIKVPITHKSISDNTDIIREKDNIKVTVKLDDNTEVLNLKAN